MAKSIFGPITAERRLDYDWVKEPDDWRERPLVEPAKRRDGRHYLSRIVDKMPGKLPVLTQKSPAKG